MPRQERCSFILLCRTTWGLVSVNFPRGYRRPLAEATFSGLVSAWVNLPRFRVLGGGGTAQG